MNLDCIVTLDANTAIEVRRFRFREALSELGEHTVDVLWDGLDPGWSGAVADVVLQRARPRDAHDLEDDAAKRARRLRRTRGIIRAVESLGELANGLRLYRLEIVSSLWRLSQRVRNRVFTGMTVPQILRAVLDDARLYLGDDLVLGVTRTEPREICVQLRESDLAFVSRLLEEEGLAFRFGVGSDDREKLEVFDDGARSRGVAVLSPHLPVEQAGSVVTEARAQIRPAKVALVDYDYLRAERRVREGDEDADVEIYPARCVWPKGSGAFDDARSRAQLRTQAEYASQFVVRGVLNDYRIHAGDVVTAQGVDARPELIVLTVVDLAGGIAAPGEVEGGQLVSTFEAILGKAVFRPALQTPCPRIEGLQTATVTGPDGAEVSTDHLGRVQIRFQWEPPTATRTTPCWVRVLQGPWAGAGWGHQFIPRVGMEVAVAFMDGDPDRPLVVGALYNATHVPPFDPHANPLSSGLKTRRQGPEDGGNTLRFDDARGAERIFLEAQRDLVEHVKHDHTLEVDGKEALHVAGGRRTEVAADDRTRVRGTSELSVEGAITATSAQKIRLAVAGATLTLTDQELTISVPNRVTITCGGTRVQIDPNGIHLSTPNGSVHLQEGEVTVAGTAVRVDGTKSVAVTSSTIVHVEGHTVSIQGNPVKINS